MNNTDFSSATQMRAALTTGDVSALQLCDAAIARIEANPALNAVVVQDFERARQQARAADDAIARGQSRPLLGVPMTVKEAFNVAGLPTTWGFAFNAAYTASEDAVAVARLKAAGAVILGKTNVALGLGDYESNNPVYGRTVNPLDPARSPGGSSGGSAAALAAGLVPLELGSDIGGSIRVPAHFCGVMGHKPTHGLLPTRGHEFPRYPAAPDPLSVIGPLARTADDLALALRVLAGPDAWDALAYALSLPTSSFERAEGLRVLALRRHPACVTSQGTQNAVAIAAQRLSKQGARVSDASSLLPDLMAIHADYVQMLQTIVTRGMPGTPPPINAHQWLGLLDRRLQWQRGWQKLFEHFDAVIAPVFGCEAFPHLTAPDWDTTQLDIDGKLGPYRDQLAWSGLATVAGLPSTVVPISSSVRGLPVGVQIIGPLFDDLSTIRLAGCLETTG